MHKTIRLELNAENPQIPLTPSCPIAGSAASFTILNVPRPLGKRTISAVYVQTTNVDGVTRSFAAMRNGSAWGATVPAPAIGNPGRVTNGVSVWASGTDDNGEPVPCWVLGVGDLAVGSSDGTVAPGKRRQAMHVYAARPDSPVFGDVAPSPSNPTSLEIYFNGTWRPFGGGSADVAGKLPVKPLPKYLHALSFDDPYKADAEAWYESLAPDAMGGACSAVRRGGKLYRNYDWTFDNAAEFVVRMSAAEGRHASVGAASLGAALTEDEVMSGVYTAKYRALPGMTLDGINDAGVVAEINVDGGPKTDWHGTGANAIHILAAVRWVLDHGETAQQAAEYIAANVKQPQGKMNFHFMIADATKTYIVENGEANDVTDGVKVLTNYGVFDTAQAGGGKERYALLAGGEDISAVNWTNAYQQGNDWHSDFESEEQHAAAIEQWAAQGDTKEAHRGKTTASGQPWWQSVHTTEYDFAAKTMRVAVQESGEYFTFAVASKVDAYTKAETDEKLAAKRDKTDLTLTEPKNVHWTWTSDDPNCPEDFIDYMNSYGSEKPFWNELESYRGWQCWVGKYQADGTSPGSSKDDTEIEMHFSAEPYPFSVTLTRESATDTTPVEVDALALVSQLPKTNQLLTAEQRTAIADVANKLAKADVVAPAASATAGQAADAKDTHDALGKKADEFSEWVPDEDAPSDLIGQPEYNAIETSWYWYTSSGVLYFAPSDTSDKVSASFSSAVIGAPTFIATRKRVLRTGDAATSLECGSGAAKQTVAVENGVAKLDDFFRESNSLLTGTIEAKVNSMFDNGDTTAYPRPTEG